MLQSFRLGFATNSSSAHSIILHSDPAYMRELEAYSVEDANGYGRDTFSFVDADNKLAYLIWLHDSYGAMNRSAHETMDLVKRLPEFAGNNLVAIRERMASFEPESAATGALCPKNIDLGLWLDFMVNGPVSIHGYDDNSTPHFEFGVRKDPAHKNLESMTFRQDGDALIGYSANSGQKFRWSRTPYTKSRIPELVDLKITDHCGWGCKFCYQGSTKDGGHAPIKRLIETLDSLAAAGVFEVAIGGGEPVDHPDFDMLIQASKKRNITFNFTTYGVEWAADRENPILRAMRDSYWRGGIGVSVHSLKDVDKADRLDNYLQAAGIYGRNVMAQTVIGATPMKATQAILDRCIESDRPLLLLGYKTTGRGQSFTQREAKREQVKSIIEQAKAHLNKPLPIGDYGYVEERNFTLSVDTAFLDMWGDVLDEVGIPHVLRTSPEGKFSMYIDGVTNMAAPSSYCAQDQYVPWDSKNLESIFAQF